MRITTGTDFDNIPEDDRIRYIGIFGDQVKNAVNGNISFLDNIRCAIRDVLFSASGVDTQINHGLGGLPNGYILVSASAPMAIYSGDQGSDRQYIYLRSNAIGSAKVLIF